MPAARSSCSSARTRPKMAWVGEATRPGVRTPRRQSISVASRYSERSDRSGPTAAIVSPSVTTATSVRDSSLLISGPRRARPGPAQVTTSDALTKMSRGIRSLPRSRRAHHVTNPGEAERCLRLTSAGIVAGVAVDRLVGAKILPVKIRREIGAALHAPGRIEMNSANAGAARLTHLAARITRQLLEIVIGVGDHPAATALEGEQPRHERIQRRHLVGTEEELPVAVLGIGVDAEIDAESELRRALDDRFDLIEVVVPDDGVESDVVDAERPQSRQRVEELRREPRNSAGAIVTAVDVIEGNVELIDARAPQRECPLGREHRAMSYQHDVLETNRAGDCSNELFEIGTEQRLTAREGHEHWIEESRRVGEARQLGAARLRIGAPVVAETAACVTAQRHFEVHENGAAP